MWDSDALGLQPLVSMCELHRKRERKGKAGEESLKDSKSTFLFTATRKDAQPTSPLKCWTNSLRSLKNKCINEMGKGELLKGPKINKQLTNKTNQTKTPKS